MDNKAQTFVKGAAVLAVAGLIVKIIGAVFRIPLANIIGVDGMAYYEVVYPYYSWLLVISSAGLPTAISKLVSERVAKNDYAAAHRVFRIAFVVLVAIGIFTFLAMLLLADVLACVSGLPAAALSFRALSPALLLVSIMCAYRGYLQGLQHMEGTALSQVAEQLIKLIIGLSLAAKLASKGPEYAAMGALIGVAISELVALIVVILIYKVRKNRSFGMYLSCARSRRESGGTIMKRLFALAIPITIGASIMPMTGIADSVMIMNTLTSIGFSQESAQTAYGLLRGNVTVFINMPAVLTMALAMSLVPAISACMAEGDSKGMRRASRTGLKLSLIIGAPCAAGLYVMGGPIIGLLYRNLSPEELALAADLMRTASVGVLFLSMVQALTGVIQGLGKPTIPVINLVYGGVLKVGIMALLMRLPSVNIQGAAISTVICYATAAVLDLCYLLRRTGMRLSVVNVFIKPIGASVIMALITYFAYGFFKGYGSVGTVATLCVAVAVYGVLFFVLKMFSREDLSLIPGGGKLAKLMYRGRS